MMIPLLLKTFISMSSSKPSSMKIKLNNKFLQPIDDDNTD